MAETQQKKPIVPIVIGAVAVVVVVIIAVVMLTPKKKVTVPSVTYYYQRQAEQMLVDAGLKLGKVTEEQNTESYEGLILNQSPAADQSVDEGSTVDITIAKGLPIPTELEVPDLKGMSPEDAEITLILANIFPLLEGSANSDDVEPGMVCEQDIAAGTKISITKEDFEDGNWPVLSYKTSLGKEQVKVPDVIGKTDQEARDALKGAGLAIDTTNSYNDKVEQGRIISQSVAKDTTVPKGTVVSIEISLGKKPVNRVTVPDIRTYNFDEAKRSLESAGLKYTYSGDTSGRVITVKPTPGTEVDEGSTVDFTIQRTAEQVREEQERKRQQEEQQRQQQEEQRRQQEEQRQREEDERRQQEEQDRQRQEEEQRQQEQQQQQQQEQQQQEQRQLISEADAIVAAVITAVDDPNDPSVDNVRADLVDVGDTRHYVVTFTTDTAGYQVTIDAYTGEVIDTHVDR